MRLQVDVTPESFRLLLVVAGAALVLVSATLLGDAVKEMKYQPVYGANSDAQPAPVSQKTLALPVVAASSPIDVSNSDGQADDALIEKAFSVPVVVEEPSEEDAPQKVTLAQQMFLMYRPEVQGVGDGGAFIRGEFWSVGETIMSMPVRDSVGQTHYPSIKSIGSGVVSLTVAGETLSLQYPGTY